VQIIFSLPEMPERDRNFVTASGDLPVIMPLQAPFMDSFHQGIPKLALS
jgi:hypothetical protein